MRLFRNGRNQALRIPREFELESDEAILRWEDGRLIVEPVRSTGLLAVLSRLKPIPDSFPDLDQDLLPVEDFKL